MASSRLLRPQLILIAVVALAPARAAHASAPDARVESAAQEPEAKARDPKTALEPHSKNADSPKLLAESARPYADARKLLARGRAALALKALAKQPDDGLFADREALLKGDAYLALGELKRAKEAYLEAIEKSELKAVSVAAARGLVGVLAVLKQRDDELLYLEALLEEPQLPRRSNLLLQKALVLRDLGRAQESAEVAWKLIQDHPAARVSIQANGLLKEFQKKGVKIPVSTAKVEIARIRSLVQSGEYRRAEIEIDRLEKLRPKMKKALALERAEIYKRRRMKQEEFDLLSKLYLDGGLGKDEGAELLWRLGRIAMNSDETTDDAIRYFDELEAKYPGTSHCDEAQYLAAWIPYNQGKYDSAIERMLSFATKYKKSPNRSEALWFAGWSAYLANRDGLARRAFDQLLEEHPMSELRPQVRYWLGRIRQRANDPEGARQEYREVLAIGPLAYWGFWAMTRLKELGEDVVLNPPPPTEVAPIPRVVEMLGPERPRGIDRAIALHQADLPNDALDELTAVNAYLKSVKDTAGRTMVADMLQALGAHYLAYRVGASIASDGAELVTGKPWAWRAWRHAYPNAFESAVSRASEAHAIDQRLILSIMRTESSFRPQVKSPVGAYGLMQVMPATAQQIGRTAKEGRPHAARFRDPDSNVWLGGWYLAHLVTRYGGQLAPAIGAYNAGPGAMDKWIAEHGGLDLDEFVERIPYRETRRYVRRVLETYLIYRRLNGEPLIDLHGKVRDMLVQDGSIEF
jgi:peptidoglycan lytic transglycosylase